MSTTINEIAGTAEKVIEGIMRIEPMIATAASMFVPGAAPVVAMVQPEILMAIPYVELALKKIAAGQNLDGASAMFELIKHLMPSEANSAALSPTVIGDDPSARTVG